MVNTRNHFIMAAVESLEATDPEAVAAMVAAAGMKMNTTGQRISIEESGKTGIVMDRSDRVTVGTRAAVAYASGTTMALAVMQPDNNITFIRPYVEVTPVTINPFRAVSHRRFCRPPPCLRFEPGETE
jgi:hypothetical protein